MKNEKIKNEKYFTKITKKRQENTAQAHISLLSQIEQWEMSGGGGNNIRTTVLKTYL